MLLRRGPYTGLDHISAPTQAVLLLIKLFLAALKDRDLERFATFGCNCLVINDHQRNPEKELFEGCLSWGN